MSQSALSKGAESFIESFIKAERTYINSLDSGHEKFESDSIEIDIPNLVLMTPIPRSLLRGYLLRTVSY